MLISTSERAGAYNPRNRATSPTLLRSSRASHHQVIVVTALLGIGEPLEQDRLHDA
jgi:hypothetical protein